MAPFDLILRSARAIIARAWRGWILAGLQACTVNTVLIVRRIPCKDHQLRVINWYIQHQMLVKLLHLLAQLHGKRSAKSKTNFYCLLSSPVRVTTDSRGQNTRSGEILLYERVGNQKPRTRYPLACAYAPHLLVIGNKWRCEPPYFIMAGLACHLRSTKNIMVSKLRFSDSGNKRETEGELAFFTMWYCM